MHDTAPQPCSRHQTARRRTSPVRRLARRVALILHESEPYLALVSVMLLAACAETVIRGYCWGLLWVAHATGTWPHDPGPFTAYGP